MTTISAVRRRARGRLAALAVQAVLISVAFVGGEPRPAIAAGGSYRKIDSEGDVSSWYRTRGEAFVGKAVHIHVPRAVFRDPIAPEKRRTTSRNLEFADRGIPILVSPGSPYFQQYLRKRAGGGKTVLLFGKIKHYKGTDLLIEAFAKLPEAVRQTTRLRIVGEPFIDIEPLKARAAELGIADRVDWDLRYVGDAEIGPILAADAFYTDRPDLYDRLAEYGVLAVEMESAALYTIAARFGARALTLLTVSDHIKSGEHTTAQEREQTFGQMVEIALDAIIA